MNTKEKMKIIATLPVKGVVCVPHGNQSIKVTFPCGCNFIRHLAVRSPVRVSDQTETGRVEADRELWITLCQEHDVPESKSA